MTNKDERVVAGKAPLPIKVEAGKSYFWCSCGRSQTQPFCDGAHAKDETEFKPVKWVAPESNTFYFCTCKQTKNMPLCDGSHKSLS